MSVHSRTNTNILNTIDEEEVIFIDLNQEQLSNAYLKPKLHNLVKKGNSTMVSAYSLRSK